MTVVRWLWRLSVATALALLGLSITTAAVLAAAPEATQIYTYDSPQHPAGSADIATERGPPAFHALDIAHDAVDQWSHSDSVRFDAPVAGSTTTYDAPPTLAQVARATSTTWGQAGTLSEHPLSLQRGHVAANGATRLGETVSPLGRTYENADTYLGEVAKHYGINLRGVRPVWDHSLGPVTKGLTRQSEGGWIIRINPGFVDEADLANTIAHELSHARDFQKGLSSLEGPATASGNALEEWIYGLR